MANFLPGAPLHDVAQAGIDSLFHGVHADLEPLQAAEVDGDHGEHGLRQFVCCSTGACSQTAVALLCSPPSQQGAQVRPGHERVSGRVEPRSGQTRTPQLTPVAYPHLHLALRRCSVRCQWRDRELLTQAQQKHLEPIQRRARGGLYVPLARARCGNPIIREKLAKAPRTVYASDAQDSACY